jgi:hypothetical protein
VRECALVGIPAHLAHDWPQQRRQVAVQIVRVRGRFQHPDGEGAPDDRGHLGEPARPVGQPVDPREEEALERRGHQLGGPHGQRPRPTTVDDAALDDGAQQLLEVKRIAGRARDEGRRRRCINAGKEGAGERVRGLVRKRRECQLARPVAVLAENRQP